MFNSLLKPITQAPEPMTERKTRWGEQLFAYILLIPAVSVFAVFGWYPLIRTLVSSFFHVRLAGESTFVGLLNYRKMLADPLFVTAWKNSLEFVLWSLLLGFLLPVVLAILVNETRRLAGIFRLIYYLPVVIPITVAMIIWRAFYYPDTTGLVNYLLNQVGLPSQFWLQNPLWVKPAMVVISTWIGFGSTILIYQSALQGFPSDLYEAAELDGAGPWQRIQHFTLPYLWPLMRILLVLQALSMAQFFTLPFTMTNGGPAAATMTPPLVAYHAAFDWWDFGLAATWNVGVAVILAALSIFLFFSRREGAGR